MRSATTYPGGHSEDIDYIAWNPTHPELFCTSSQKDRRIVFWDGRREFSATLHSWVAMNGYCPSRKPERTTNTTQGFPLATELLAERESNCVHYHGSDVGRPEFWQSRRRNQGTVASGGHEWGTVAYGRSSAGSPTFLFSQKTVQGSATVFNHVGDGLVVTRTNETDPIIRALSFPGFELLHTNPSHVGGCMATALDPRGRCVLLVSRGDLFVDAILHPA